MPTHVIRRVLTAALLIAATVTLASLGKSAVALVLVLMGLCVQYELAKMLLADSKKAAGLRVY